MTVDQLLVDVKNELIEATAAHGPMCSAHEGLAVIEEELHELRLEVYKKATVRTKALLMAEARQVAAMAVRFMLDVCS